MKKTYTITGAIEHMEVDGGIEATGNETMRVHDGYHTMDELYDHRIALYITLCRVLDRSGEAYIWRSKMHENGLGYEGWYVLGIGHQDGRQISYHLPNSTWLETNFAHTLTRGIKFDGHTSADVIKRLGRL